MCAEGLSALVYEAKNVKKIKGIWIVQGALIINHLFLACDSLLFCRAKKKERLQVNNILEVYERVSSQMLNQLKTFIFFSSNTSGAAK